jgi:starch synthase
MPKKAEKIKVLYVSQEITPYLPETEMSHIGRYLPQGILEKGKEVRAFMPRYGLVNERRNQLHEVIRLSGMNIIINDNDHPLIIKVASIQSARMQVYFIDNEDFFQRKHILADDNNQAFADNDERAIFFARGVLETVTKLRWSPDIVHCHGWITSLVPLFLKKSYKEDPIFKSSKIITSVYDDLYPKEFENIFSKKIRTGGVKEKDLTAMETSDSFNIAKLGLYYSDAFINGSQQIDSQIDEYIIESNKPRLEYQTLDTYINAYHDFYNQVLAIK